MQPTEKQKNGISYTFTEMRFVCAINIPTIDAFRRNGDILQDRDPRLRRKARKARGRGSI